jgi:Ca2+-binding EF-hand superfamily protein
MNDADQNLQMFDKKVNKLYTHLEDAFRMFDEDNDGKVDRGRVCQILSATGAWSEIGTTCSFWYTCSIWVCGDSAKGRI